MSSSILESFSQISTGLRCKNCAINIVRVSWKQCIICERFNLCQECGEYPYDKLELSAKKNHIKLHENIGNNNLITSECMQPVLIQTVSVDNETLMENFTCIMQEKKIQNDIDMSIVMTKLKQMKNQSLTDSEQEIKQELCSMIIDYELRSFDRTLHVLSLDGGGVRGYMPVKVLEQLIIEKHLPDIEKFDSNNEDHREKFHQAQLNFTKQFDYFVGTSTGGLIAFCLAIGHDILSLTDIYANASYYFNRNLLGPLFRAKYDPSRIHKKIDEIIGTITLKNGKKLSAQNATLLDIHNFLNPNAFISDDLLKSTQIRHGNLLEFVDNDDDVTKINDENHQFQRVKRERVLLITAYNATKDQITIFNTSYAKHWPYRIADVLKATMAAPTYFPPQKMSKGMIENGQFISNEKFEIFVDGGIFANDPELIALWAMRMQWKKLMNYHILSLGTGTYNTPITSSNLGGYFGWLFNNGLLVNTLMEATCSLTEVFSSNLAKFNNMKRMKFNYKLKEAMSLDDASFIKIFDEEWKDLKNKNDFRTLIYFYEKYIQKQE